MIRLGVDTGGTFTDVVCYDEESGEVTVTKTPSTPSNFDEGVLTGIDKILRETGKAGGDVSFLSHGTTVGTNAVLENEMPDLGLVTNEGLRDVLEIGDQTRPELYNLQTEKPPHLIPRYLRREVPGRLDAQGDVVDPLDEERAVEVITELATEDVESVVVSLLFSYLNPDHERRVGELIEEHAPGMEYALSSEVHPEIREYDRTITTVLNEAIKRTVESYFSRLDAGIEDRGIDAPLNVMHSGGGVFSTDQATERAIRTVLSGPAAGAVAVEHASEREGFADAIGMDMGGTSADVSIVRDGDLVRSTEGEINDLPVKTPMIDVNTVGAGGGSIAWVDEGGALRVGPKSAGAAPGPVCYGRGGTDPTLTDANLVLGRIPTENFLSGEMELDAQGARRAVERELADPLGCSIEEAALSVVEVANASLAREIRRVTVERGDDPAGFALVAFGGAGPLQAPAVAAEMEMGTVLVPRNPGVFSARGLLIADARIDEIHSYRQGSLDPAPLERQYDDLAAEVRGRFEAQGFDPDEPTVERTADVRYAGQSYEITVPVPPGSLGDAELECTLENFHAEHERLYGHAMRDEPVEIVTLRVNGRVPTPGFDGTGGGETGDAGQGEREVYFEPGGFQTTAVYDRTALAPGRRIEGPAILAERGSTTLVPPGTVAEVTDDRAVTISL